MLLALIPPEVSMDIVYFSDGSDGIKREIIIILRAANINISWPYLLVA